MVPSLMHKMYLKENMCLQSQRQVWHFFSFCFVFYFTIVKRIVCQWYVTGKEDMLLLITLFSTTVLLSVSISQTCTVLKSALPWLVHSRATQLSSAKRHLIPSWFPERELNIKSLRIQFGRIQIYINMNKSLSDLRTDWNWFLSALQVPDCLLAYINLSLDNVSTTDFI